MSVIQLGKRRFASKSRTNSSDPEMLTAKLAAVESAAETLIEALDATLAAAKLIKRFSERPTPATGQLLDVINAQLQETMTGLGSLHHELKRL